MIAIIIILVLLILFELAHLSTFGKFNSSSFSLEEFDFFYKEDLKMMFDNSGNYLSKRTPTILSKWHSRGYCIPRWSKFHKEIEIKYKQLLKEQNETN